MRLSLQKENLLLLAGPAANLLAALAAYLLIQHRASYLRYFFACENPVYGSFQPAAHRLSGRRAAALQLLWADGWRAVPGADPVLLLLLGCFRRGAAAVLRRRFFCYHWLLPDGAGPLRKELALMNAEAQASFYAAPERAGLIRPPFQLPMETRP